MKLKFIRTLIKYNYSILILISSLLFSHIAHAQADRIGSGGDWNEADLKHFLSKLIPYLGSDEGKTLFPEVVEYNQKHKKSVEDIAKELNPHLVNQPVYDSKGNERDCISYELPIRYFECNLKSLPPKPSEDALHEQKSEYYGSMYRLVLHEVFVQVGLEKPLSKEVPSDYALSSRLMVHLEAFPEWVPGAEPSAQTNKNDIITHSAPEWAVSVGAGTAAGSTFAHSDNNSYFSSNPSIFHVAATIKFRLPITMGDHHFKLGLSTGFEYGFASLGDWTIPTMINFEYNFQPFHQIRPYLGFAFGIGINHYRQTTHYHFPGYPAFDDSYASSRAFLPIRLIPGFYFGQHDRYFFEIPIAYFSGKATIIPSLGMTF